MNVKMYHKKSCSTSKKALEILRNANIEPELILYLDKVPTKRSLRSLAKKLGGVENLIRKKESVYQNLFANKEYSVEEWIDVLRAHPNLIERPIIIKGRKAVIARPMEKMLDLLKIKE